MRLLMLDNRTAINPEHVAKVYWEGTGPPRDLTGEWVDDPADTRKLVIEFVDGPEPIRIPNSKAAIGIFSHLAANAFRRDQAMLGEPEWFDLPPYMTDGSEIAALRKACN